MSHQTYLDYISSYFKSSEDFVAFQEALKKPLSKTITLVQSRSKTEDTLRQLNEEGFQTIVSDYNANNFKVARLLSSEVTKSLSSEVTKLEHSNLVTSAPSNLSQPSNISQPIGKTIGHLLGNFYIQETAASLPAIYVDIPMEGHILDMCAAPGGKTMQLGDRCKVIGSKAIVRANEPDSKRLQVLESNIARCGMDNVVITQHGGEQFGNLVPEMFDVILLDAPCSGEGTGFKSDFGTKFWDIHKIKQIAHLQYQLLESALKACKVGGQIMYSTCTINSVENEENVIKLMESYPGILEIEEIENKDIRSLSHYDTKPLGHYVTKSLGHYVAKPLSNGITKLEPSNLATSQPSNLNPSNINPSNFKRLRPHIQHTGGFFMCKIRKTGSLHKEQPIKSGHKIKAAKYALCNQIAIRNWLKNEFGISISDELTFIQSKNQIYLSHTSIIPYLQLLHIYCPGLAVIKGEKEQDWRPLHDAGLVFDFHSDYQLPLDKEQLLKHINQEDFELNTNQRQDSKQGFVQLLYDNNKVGIGKIVGITIKNKFQGIL